MAITDDVSTPAVATGTGVGDLVTASFSPPSGSMLVVMAAAGYAGSPTVPGISLADSVGGTWIPGPTVGSTAGAFFGRVSMWFRYLSSAPGSMTVTASFSNLTGGRHMQVKVLNGCAAVQTGQGTATRDISVSDTNWTTNLTTTQVGSRVFAACDDPVTDNALTAGANSTLIHFFDNTTDQVSSAFARSTADTVTPGSTSFGFANANGSTGVLALMEILSDGGAAPSSGYVFTGLRPDARPGPFGLFFSPPALSNDPAPPITNGLGVVAGVLAGLTSDVNGFVKYDFNNNAEGGTSGVTVGAADAGSGDVWNLVTIGTGASVVYTDTPVLYGRMAIKFDVGVTSSSAYVQRTFDDQAVMYAGCAFSYEQTFGASASIFSFNSGGTAHIRVQVTAANKLRVLDSAGATLYTSTATLSAGTKYFLSLRILGAVSGTYDVDLWDVATRTIIESTGTLSGDIGGSVDRARFGSVANQTNANWHPVTMDQFRINNFEKPVPPILGAMAGTLGGLTADLDGTAKGNAALAGTLGTVTGDFDGIGLSGTNNAVLAGTLGGLTADLNGTAKGNAALAGTLGGFTADLNGTAKGNAALAGTLGDIIADLNGTVDTVNDGPLAGTLGGIVADLNGTAKASAPLVGTLGSVTADLNGTAKSNAALAGTLGDIVVDLNGTDKANAALAGTLGDIVADLNGTAKDNATLPGMLAHPTSDLNADADANPLLNGVLSKLQADLNGSAAGGYLNGILGGVSADLNGAGKDNGTLAGALGVVAADVNGTVRDSSTLAGSLRSVTGDVNGTAKDNATVATSLGSVAADVNGTTRASGTVAGQLADLTTDINAAGKASAAVAGTLASLTGDLNGTSEDAAILAGALSSMTAYLTGSSPDTEDQSDLMIFFSTRYGHASY